MQKLGEVTNTRTKTDLFFFLSGKRELVSTKGRVSVYIAQSPNISNSTLKRNEQSLIVQVHLDNKTCTISIDTRAIRSVVYRGLLQNHLKPKAIVLERATGLTERNWRSPDWVSNYGTSHVGCGCAR